jgi:hypothetical protein
MSWIKENYHIAALGGGALVLAGLGYLGLSSNQAVNDEFNANNPPKGKNTDADGLPEATEVLESLTQAEPVEYRPTESGRPVDLFTSVDLYTKDGNDSELQDILKLPPVHPPIPNQWWVDHRIDPSYSDSPQKDQDGDGFTNGEEFAAKTDPNDPKAHGALITKLEVAEVESDMWLLLFKSVLGKGYQFDLLFKPFGGRSQTNRIPASDAVSKGDSFFKEDPAKGRFKLIDVVAREEDGPTGRRPRNWAIVEDQDPSKNKKQYETPFNMAAAQKPLFTEYDHEVTFRLNAIGEAGNQFKVAENGTFSLPSGGADGDKVYKLVEIILEEAGPQVRKPVKVVVSYPEGTETKTIEIDVPQTESAP